LTSVRGGPSGLEAAAWIFTYPEFSGKGSAGRPSRDPHPHLPELHRWLPASVHLVGGFHTGWLPHDHPRPFWRPAHGAPDAASTARRAGRVSRAVPLLLEYHLKMGVGTRPEKEGK